MALHYDLNVFKDVYKFILKIFEIEYDERFLFDFIDDAE